jgi:membrane-associated phospholipid phosphatase
MSSALEGVPGREASRNHRWVRAWPLRKRALLHVGLGGLLLLVMTTGVGLVFMRFFDDGPIGDADRAAAQWLEDRRTPTVNTLTDYGSMLSETLVKVALVAVVGGAFVLIVRRWHDGVFLALVVILEATVFVIASFIVDRDRPPVEQLDPPAPSGSFPSGHTGAAVAFYGGLFIVVCWHTRHRIVRTVFAVVAVAAPLAVGFSRVARGMHHPIDVAAGMLLGVGTLFVVRGALTKGVEEIDREADSSVAQRVRRLDLATPAREPIEGGHDARAVSRPTGSSATGGSGTRPSPASTLTVPRCRPPIAQRTGWPTTPRPDSDVPDDEVHDKEPTGPPCEHGGPTLGGATWMDDVR